jgi:hypothetical protein
MAMEGLFALACASALVAAGPGPATPADDARGHNIDDVLAVQTAMQQGRDYLLHNNAATAVEVLERQLHLINGNQRYLALLREAYRLRIHDLTLAKQEAAARVYADRLRILEWAPSAGPAAPTPAAVAATVPAQRPMVARACRDDQEETTRLATVDRSQRARDLLAQAEQHFNKGHYHEAGGLFEQAHGLDGRCTDASGERWAYCKLHGVVEQLNARSSAYAAMETEIRSALSLAPGLDYGKRLLNEISKRRGDGRSGPARAAAGEGEIAVRELGLNADGWQVAETANFRVFYRQSSELAEQAARVAERTRTAMYSKWFGAACDDWNPKCDLFLHATGQDYNQATRAPVSSPGHSSFRYDDHGQLASRRIDLRCDHPDLLTAVLPHETTHTVLAGSFGAQQMPRWADEGMAVLTEPRDKIERYLRNLPQHYQDRHLFQVRQLMQMPDYPHPDYVGAFYAQSVSIVEFLTNKEGPRVFADFVRDGLKDGYEAALRKHYKYQDFAAMQEDWLHATLGEANASAGVAQANP